MINQTLKYINSRNSHIQHLHSHEIFIKYEHKFLMDIKQ